MKPPKYMTDLYALTSFILCLVFSVLWAESKRHIKTAW